jgi:hypothetical protein
MNQMILKFHQSASSDKSKKIYETYANHSKFAVKAVIVVLFGINVCCLTSPLAVKLITGYLVLPFGFKFPWIDVSTIFGYSFNFCYQILQSYIAVAGFSVIEGMFAINMLQSYCVYDDLYQMLDELNDELKDTMKRNSTEIRRKFVKILQKHQDLLR